MIKTAGVVFDFYDDNGARLQEKLAGREIPDVILDAVVLDESDFASLPDNVFAGVIKNGDETLRKFACVDKGNTMVSAIYFLDSQYNFPSSARTKIAQNLVAACRHFEVVPPPALAKTAAGRTLIQGDGAEMIVPREGEKTADLSGTSLMPITAGPPDDKRKKKLASVISDPYVDVTSRTADPKPDYSVLDDSLYALVSRDGNHREFPLQSMEQVKTAADFFTESSKRFHPRTRREFCQKLAARADQIGYDIPDIIRKYGSATFAPDGEIEMAFDTRRQLWRDHHDEAESLLNGLLEKKASGELPPEIFAETLFEVDKLFRGDRYYDRNIPDPWLSTFGIQKEAEWRWVKGNDVLTEEELKTFVTSSNHFIKRNFSEELAEGLSKNPVSVFESLPLPQQRTIARLAHQFSDGGSNAQIGHL